MPPKSVEKVSEPRTSKHSQTATSKLTNPNNVDAGNVPQSLIQKKAPATSKSKTSTSDASVSHGDPTKWKQTLQTVSDNDDSKIKEIAPPPPKKAKSKDAANRKHVEMEKMNDDGFLQDLNGLEDIGDNSTESRTQDVDHFFMEASKDPEGRSKQCCKLCL
ncbi:hypothetical protein M422DRAFT_267412 [Sphaerobolus stellatus SS14]|uniref:Unplaced genomic scaffold SPHSTscaffold_175, whole genome shotgun sequence n=1 Tax=Sphaerobolus stellatus (strain SS14) TaxID=990650 RepID=A0A0C9U953_SPHS4|nr:hypothetical protein M422DRAFT_267412 [Sphaerobolus stellatus SS14]